MRKGLPGLGSLRSDSPGATQKRRAFFEALALDIPGAEKIVLLHPQDGRWINVEYEVYYPKRFEVPSSMRPFVRLEPGLRPWRPPTILKDLSSFLHQHVDSVGLRTAYADNRPSGIECVHPFVTLVDKLDSVTKRYGRAQFAAEEFARHYEDLAHLVSKIGDPEPLSEATKLEVVDHCLAARSVLPDDPAFVLADPEKRALLERAYAAIAPMFWGERISLDACCERVARWLTENPLRPNRGEAGS